MDPDGLEDALDLSKDRSQNQVCFVRVFAVCAIATKGCANSTKGVYIYQPAKPGKADRPSKRRKVSTGDNQEQPTKQTFVPLLNGDESAECVQLRYDTYKELWSEQERKIQVGNMEWTRMINADGAQTGNSSRC